MKRRLDRYAGLRSRMGEDPAAAVREELEHHLESRIAEYVAAGWTRDAAEREARRRMGDMDRYAEETSKIDALRGRDRRRRELVAVVWRELRQSVRTLSRAPWFALAAIATLGLGLGATGSVGTLVDRVVLRPLPYPEADRLVNLASRVDGTGFRGQWGLSEAGYFDYRSNASTLSNLGAYVQATATISGDGAAERVPAMLVTSSLQNVLRFRPAAGRLFTEADDTPDAARVVVLSHAFWQQRYGGDPTVIGRTIDLNASPAEVVGVLSPGDGLPDRRADVWLPVQFDPAARPVNSHYVRAIGRLSAGATVESARSELDRLTARFPDIFPTAYSPRFMEDTRFHVEIVPLRDQVLGDSGRLLWVLFASVVLVLVIACTNVANLFLVRAEVRRRESVVRAALGGDRSDLALHYITESLVIALCGAALGLLIAWAAVTFVVNDSAADLPRLSEVRFGWTGIAAIVATAAVAGFVFGLFPLARIPRDASTVLRDGGRGLSVSKGQQTLRSVLVAGQMAVALTLLVSAGLMVRSWSKLRAVDPGFEAEDLLTLELRLPIQTYDSWDRTYTFHRTLIDRVRDLPRVRGAATSTVLPLDGPGPCASMFVENRPQSATEEPPCLSYRLASPGWFEVMGTGVTGRTPGWEDVVGGSGAIVVTGAAARMLWPAGNAIGGGTKSNGDQPPFYRVSGVTEDIHGEGLDAPPSAEVYFPLMPMPGAQLWSPPASFTLAVRTSAGDPMAVLPEIRRIVAHLDADVPIANARLMETVVSQSMARTSFTLLLLVGAAGMALVLCIVGMYGLIAYVVGQRRAEIGIRMALGARAAEVVRMVVVRSLLLAGAGIGVGLVLTFASVRVLRSMLYEVSPNDPVTLLAVAVLLAALAAAASWGPARRAARVDPMQVMRSE